MKYFVYILYSKFDQGLYIGFTKDLNNRFSLHSKGKVPSTSHRLPLELIYFECFVSIKDAKSREKYLKSGYGRQQLKCILKDTMSDLNQS